jgi:hypothetical protein
MKSIEKQSGEDSFLPFHAKGTRKEKEKPENCHVYLSTIIFKQYTKKN